jgi:hypothetical protein
VHQGVAGRPHLNNREGHGEITLSGVIPAISQSEIIRQVEIVPRVKKVVADFVSLYGQARRSG